MLKDDHHILAFEHPNGRIYSNRGGLAIAPAWIANDYIQWSEEHQKYGLYKYAPSSDPDKAFYMPGSAVARCSSHDRVGTEPSFEKALDWLLSGGRK